MQMLTVDFPVEVCWLQWLPGVLLWRQMDGREPKIHPLMIGGGREGKKGREGKEVRREEGEGEREGRRAGRRGGRVVVKVDRRKYLIKNRTKGLSGKKG